MKRIAGIFLLALFLSGCVESVFYYPDSVVYDTPARLGLRHDAVTFKSKDGTQLSGWFIPAAGVSDPRKAKGTVVHFHGNAQNMTAHWQLVSWLPQRGFNLFVFDYRGYGASLGKPGVKGVFEDSNSALDYVRARPDVDANKLVVLGQSLGGANAIAVVGSGNKQGVKAVVIEGTFYSYSSIAGDKVSGAGLLVSDTYSAERYVAGIAPVPLLLIHGTADTVIPYTHAGRLLARAGEPKRLVTMEGAGHLDAFSERGGEARRDLVVDFILKALAS